MAITSDCSFQWIAINEKNSALNPLNSKSTQQFKLRRQHPLGISCSCFHTESSMLVVAGPTKEGEFFDGNTFFHINSCLLLISHIYQNLFS